jgi:phytoene synthase
MMALIMGVAPDDANTLDRAEHLGLAFQLANIARDVREDFEGRRCYLPEEWLNESPLALENRGKTAALTRQLAELAAGYEASARVGARRLPFRSRWAVLAAAGIYGDIAREVARRGEAALDARVVTSGPAKLAWVVRAFLQALGRRSGRGGQARL